MELKTRLTEKDLENIAAHLELKLHGFRNEGISRDGLNKYKFTLKPLSDRYRRAGHSMGQHKPNITSFNGYTKFMGSTFKKDKEAEFKSTHGTVNNENIIEMIDVVGNKNIGNEMQPMIYSEAVYEPVKKEKKMYA